MKYTRAVKKAALALQGAREARLCGRSIEAARRLEIRAEELLFGAVPEQADGLLAAWECSQETDPIKVWKEME